ncbi:semaphorin-5A-like, partial [Patella vulgata]|uniref:semaphorin-5A-like n=1 Tax=Patella vulgata TaxID=6465 RepID=UPI0024A87205
FVSCKVDGAWELWTQWSECTVTCGGGKQQRDRKCNEAQHGGLKCIGARNESRVCNEFHCPGQSINSSMRVKCLYHRNIILEYEHLPFSDWSEWTKCPVTCAGGILSRQRICDGPYFDGKTCDGQANQAVECNTSPCPGNKYDGYGSKVVV